MRILHFDCFSGIAGDMVIAAMLDLGLPLEFLESELEKLGLSEQYSLDVSLVTKDGISGHKFDVKVLKDQHHRHYSDIISIIDSSLLSQNIKKTALDLFRVVAEAESKIHRIPIDKIHFHEVGAIDSIVDLVGTAVGIEYFKPDMITSSPVPIGTGEIRCEHGVMPNPAPATAEILCGVPIIQLQIERELTTPTGAAIIKVLVDDFKLPPLFRANTIGFGAGTFSIEGRPNILRLLLGESESASQHHTIVKIEANIVKIEANIDDMSPQLYQPLIEALFAAGAVDTALIPIQMKKERPGTRLEVLVHEPLLDKVATVLFKHSTTIGFRYQTLNRRCLEREIKTVKTRFGDIPVKYSYLNGELIRSTPEYDSCLKLAKEHNTPVAEILGAVDKIL